MSKLNEMIAHYCPDGVNYQPLGKVCKLVTGATPSKIRSEYWENGTIPWMSSGEVNNKVVYDTEQKITQLGYDSASTTIVPIHSVVIALAGQGKTRGKVAITEIELCTNQSLCSIICGESLHYKFLYYYLDSKYLELRSISNGDGSRGGLSLKILSPYEIPVPPLPVQSEIVRILDTFTKFTAELAVNLSEELATRKKQYECYRNTLLSFGENIPRVKLADMANMFKGEYITKKDSKEGDIPVILGGQEPAYFIDRYNHCGEIVTISRSGASAGFVSYWDEPIFLTDGFGFEAKLNVVTHRYLFHVLKNMERDLNNMKRGAGVPHISGEALQNILLPLPSMEEQKRVVSILDRFDALCKDITVGLSTEMAARQKQYEYYRDKLLTFKEIDKNGETYYGGSN